MNMCEACLRMEAEGADATSHWAIKPIGKTWDELAAEYVRDQPASVLFRCEDCGTRWNLLRDEGWRIEPLQFAPDSTRHLRGGKHNGVH